MTFLSCRAVLARAVFAVALLAAWLLSASAGFAQLSSKTDLEEARNKHRTQLFKLLDGSAQATAADKEVIESAAKWYVHRLDWPIIRSDVKKMHDLQADMENEMINRVTGTNAKGKQAFVNQMGPALVRAMRPLLDMDFLANRVVVLNGAAMLPSMAKLKQDDLGEFLTEIVKDDKRHDAVKLHAIAAMREYMPVTPLTEDSDTDNKTLMRRKAADVARVDALVAYLERGLPNNLPKEEADAARYLRRNALETLALAGTPAVSAMKKKGAVEGPVAPTLLRILSPKSGLEPAPGLAEKIEAMVGLAQMKFPNMPEYNPEPAIHLIGVGIIQMANEYSTDYVNFSLKGKDRKLPIIAWKAQAKRLELALKDLLSNTAKANAGKDAAIALEAQARPILQAINSYDQVQGVVNFRNLVEKLRPKSGAAFKSLKAAEVELE
jgi:hypothetical protein